VSHLQKQDASLSDDRTPLWGVRSAYPGPQELPDQLSADTSGDRDTLTRDYPSSPPPTRATATKKAWHTGDGPFEAFGASGEA
jgi:hypothetical protein